jgi:type II secretory pathway pseudopilin PulG
MRTQDGLTLIEVTLTLLVSVIVLGALMPTASSVIRHAETTAATEDMENIRDAILSALSDIGLTLFTNDGTSTGTRVEILVGDGDVPREISATGNASWRAEVSNTQGKIDFLERHLVTNNPRGSAANDYPTTGGTPWRGAYLTAPIDPGPWAGRYAVNVEFLGAAVQDVVVYSTGPDGEVDSAYRANPLVAGDDDIIVLVEA